MNMKKYTETPRAAHISQEYVTRHAITDNVALQRRRCSTFDVINTAGVIRRADWLMLRQTGL